MQEIAKKLIQEAVKIDNFTQEKLQKLKNRYSEQYNISSLTHQELILAHKELMLEKKIQKTSHLEKFFKKRAIRSLSGVAVVTVLTKPYPCPGKCVFCPTENRMPKSYLSNEPGAMRALLNDFDPEKQVKNRIKALEASGHPTDKIELIVLGGTFSFYPRKYQNAFIRRCINALNGGKKERRLKEAQKKNEKALHRLVGLSLETRPDYIDEEEIRYLRKLGCTKIQLGVQHLDNSVLDYNKRGHHDDATRKAIQICKDAGLKVSIHMMPDLPGSTPKKDLEMFEKLWSDPAYRPDYLKIYPCVVTPYSELQQWYEKGEYHSYPQEVLEKLLVEIKKTIPPYVRIDRLIRDIPGDSILEGNKITNLRQELAKKYPDLQCKCIRCREIKDTPVDTKKIHYKKLGYEASEGKEFFLSYHFQDKLCALLRLRFPSKKMYIPELEGASIIREVHTYGLQLRIGTQKKKATQHLGLGKKLVKKAEQLSQSQGYKKIAVIASIGTREYYKKLGYKIEETYMTKKLQ